MIALGADLQLGWIYLFKLDNTGGWNLICFFFGTECIVKTILPLIAVSNK